MHFGMFMEFQTRPDVTCADSFAEGMELVDRAEAWGLDSAWLAEFHFTPGRSVLSSPIAVASAIAGRTHRIGIGTAVYVLPLNHPLRIAEEIATLDHLCQGRLEVGVGRSGFVGSYRTYGVPYDQSQARFEETMTVLRRAWGEERFDHHGEFFDFEGAKVWPKPLQQPHPPLRMAATTSATFARVGEQGLAIFVGLRGDGLGELQSGLERYRAAWPRDQRGAPNVYLRVPVYAAAHDARARQEAEDTLVYYFERQSALVAGDAERRGDDTNAGQRAATAAALASLSYDDILATRAVVGGPTAVIEQLRDLRDALGLDGVVMELNAGGRLSREQVLHSLRLITHEVMPAFA